jgi:zinc protease
MRIIGRKIDQVEGWPQAIAKVTPEDVKKAANAYLDALRSVTGCLLPEQDDVKCAGDQVQQPVVHTRS